MEPKIFALRGTSKRPATQEEIETTKPFYQAGNNQYGKTGILFIHGFTVTPANFRAYANFFADQGFTVSIPLLPGHSTVPEDLLNVTRQDWLDAVIQAYDDLNNQCENVFVVGISLGAALALHLSIQRAGIVKAFLISPAVYPVTLLKIGHNFIFPLLKALGVKFWIHVAGDVKDKSAFELGYGKTPLNGLSELYHLMHETQALLKKVTTDTLIFQGKVDHEVPAKKAQDIYTLLGSKNKELIWLDNSYHEIPRDFDAEKVRQILFNHIQKSIPTSEETPKQSLFGIFRSKSKS